jgi:hypothetical protein
MSFRGVKFAPGKGYFAVLRVGKQSDAQQRGPFEQEHDAARAYDSLLLDAFGPTAAGLNFPIGRITRIQRFRTMDQDGSPIWRTTYEFGAVHLLRSTKRPTRGPMEGDRFERTMPVALLNLERKKL